MYNLMTLLNVINLQSNIVVHTEILLEQWLQQKRLNKFAILVP